MLHGNNSDRPMPTYENELNVLHDLISQAVSVLLADNVNPVKQALMENSVTQLAVFFGKPKGEKNSYFYDSLVLQVLNWIELKLFILHAFIFYTL